MKINIRHNSPKIADAIARAPEQVLPEIDQAMRQGAEQIARQARADAPQAFSHLRNSIDVVSQPLLKTVLANAAYGSAVEFGSRPGGRPTLGETIQWIGIKRISPRDPLMSVPSLAFLIRRKIGRSGIKAQPFFYPAYDKQRSALTQLLEAAATRGLAQVGT